MTLHKTFSKLFSWPIPYWLTPIGILLLVGYWNGFNWKLSTENWPFWLWLVDKGITVGSIIWAAYFAQSIFNKNALNRENRERRLKAILDLIENTTNTESDIKELINKGILDIEHDFEKIKNRVSYITSCIKVYFPSLNKDIRKINVDIRYLYNSFLINKIEKIENYQSDINYQNIEKRDDLKKYYNQKLFIINDEDTKNLLFNIKLLTNELINIHQEIESGKAIFNKV